MACQIELRNAGKAYPRTCEICGLRGACVKGLSRRTPDRNPVEDMTPTPPIDDQIRRCAQALAKLQGFPFVEWKDTETHDIPEWAYVGWMNKARELLIEAEAVRYAMEEQG